MESGNRPLVCVGNAIVDVLGSVDDGFLARHGLPKGAMRSVDGDTAGRVQDAFGSAVLVPGGSAANTAVVAAALGAPVTYLGKVRDDEAGRMFSAGMAASGISFPVPPAADGPATSRCVVAVTPDGERTMSTHLGACQTLSAGEVAANLGAGDLALFLEGYAWTAPTLAAAAGEALLAVRGRGGMAALTLSDAAIAEAFRHTFLGLARDNLVHLFFANAREARALTGAPDEVEAARRLAGEQPGTWVVTRSGDGCLVVHDGKVEAYAARPVDAVVDTTGAGDAFAGGFMAALSAGSTLAGAAAMAAFAAAHVISRVGARPAPDLRALAAIDGLFA